MNTPQTAILIRGLAELTDAWTETKARENEARSARLAIENEILDLPDVMALLKPKGTTNFGSLKIVTDFSRQWDQDRLSKVRGSVEPDFWPFTIRFDEILRGSRFLEEHHPGIWQRIVPALTLKPKKPAFSVKEVG